MNRLAPALRLAEEISQTALFERRVPAAAGFDPDRAAQEHAVNGLACSVFDTHVDSELGRERPFQGGDLLDLKMEIRHEASHGGRRLPGASRRRTRGLRSMPD